MIHSHRHSEWSRLDGTGSCDLWAETAAKLNQPALAITDHGTLSGCMHHKRACDKHGVMPIFGMEAYYKPDRTDTDIQHPYHICLYAKNLEGWHSLLRLSTEAYETGYYAGYASVDLPLMYKHRAGVVCCTGCFKSYLNQMLVEGKQEEAEGYLQSLCNIYGEDLFAEIQPHDFPEQRLINVKVTNMATQFGVPLIAASDAHYPTADWFDTYQVAAYMNMKTSYEGIEKKKAEGKRVLEFDAKTLFLSSEEEIAAQFLAYHPDLPLEIVAEAIGNTDDVFMQKFSPMNIDRTQKLPDVKSQVEDPEAVVREWAEDGFKRIDKENDPEYRERFDYEWSVLKEKAVFDYFYIVGEAVRWAKENKIRVGLGRGSAAGCLVSYLIGITDIDPIAYGLLFERFLNPNRKGMPDIDIDFSSRGRQRVKDHLADKWGHDYVADIIAHSTFKPRAVLRGVSRVLDIPYEEVMAVNETIIIRPDDEETTLEAIRPINPILDDFAIKYPDAWTHAVRLEGSPNVASKHAAGLIITSKPCAEFLPLERSKDGGMVTAFNDSAEFPIITEYLNLMKIDFLGIAGLDAQEQAIEFIEELNGEYVDLTKLPIRRDPTAADPEVLELFTKGQTLGIFQFSSSGMTSLLKHIKPDTVLDLIAANALYRPGPMEMAFEYGDRKKLPSDEIDYWHPIIKPYLEETRGIVAYQEQLMQIVQAIGGFTPGDADDMRKAMGKLYRLPGQQAQEFMQGYKSKWDAGCKHHGIADSKRDEIWEFFLHFGNYAFNKSHSASYALQGYDDAYLKRHWPLAFYASKLTVKSGDKENRPAYVREARQFNVKIEPPDINLSEMGFRVLKSGKILYGLLAINGVGDVVAREIIDNRPYKSMKDFEERMRTPGSIKVKSNVLKSLIDAGCFDSWGMRDQFTDKEKARLEKDTLGISLSTAAALEGYRDEIEKYSLTKEQFDGIPTVKQLHKTEKEQAWVQIAGEIVDVKNTQTKNGKNMAILTLASGASEYRCTVFPGPYAKLKSQLTAETLIVQGYKDSWNNTVDIKVENMMDLEQFVKEVRDES